MASGGGGAIRGSRSVVEAAHKAQEEARRCAVCRIKIKHMRREGGREKGKAQEEQPMLVCCNSAQMQPKAA